MTIPTNVVIDKTTPTIYIDDQPAQNQGYTQNEDNYYVWYTTSFSTHQVTIQFPLPSASIVTASGNLLFIVIVIPEIVLAFTVIATRKMKRTPQDI